MTMRLARCALVSFALAGLVACGGGGGDKETPTPAPEPAPGPPETPDEQPETPPATPQMTITPGGDTLANAVDATGQDTLEGSLDSDNPRAFYKIRIDEPSVLALRSEDDIDITVYDSAGNVVNPSTAGQAAVVPGAASAGGGGGRPEVSAAAALPVFVLVGGGTWIIRIERLLRAAATSTEFKVIIGLAAGGLVLKRIADLELSIDVNQEKEFDYDESFDGEAVTTATWKVTSETKTKFGTLKLVTVAGKRAVRASHVPSGQCPRARSLKMY